MSDSLHWMLPLVPEEIVILAALLVLTLDLTALRHKSASARAAACGAISAMACLAAMGWIVFGPGLTPADGLVVTPLTQFLKLLLLATTLIVGVISLDARFTRHLGEYFALLLMAASGMMLLISSDNLLVIFIALELLSLPLYTLTAFDKSRLSSAEAALKYFLFGSVAAAFTLFGISLLYGVAGDLQLGDIAVRLRSGPVEPIAYAAVAMTLAGFVFKLAAAPLHFWAPDVYEGAPPPVASFIASASKVASFFVLARILESGLAPLHGNAAWGSFRTGWLPVLAIVALLSMLLGNLAALAQSSVKRLLAYSAIAHGGYALLAFFGNSDQMLPSLLFYVITYALTALGAFAVVTVVENCGGGDRLTEWAGLGRRAPWLSACMFVFLLSLAGIPPLSGFFGKFYVFTAAMAGAPSLGLLWLVIVAVAASAISLYYYLQVLKQIYVAESPTDAPVITPPGPAIFSIVLLAAAVVALGCAPSWLLGKLAFLLSTSAF